MGKPMTIVSRVKLTPKPGFKSLLFCIVCQLLFDQLKLVRLFSFCKCYIQLCQINELIDNIEEQLCPK